jgi:OHCU decarboxylase
VRRLSDLPEAEARAALLACCGSRRWVERMLSQRPFKDADEVFAAAERLWWDLEPEDWLEAFRAHPRIGETPGEGAGSGHGAGGAPVMAGAWSRQEQASVTGADAAVRAALAEANRAYEARFGHLFIVCATGKSAEEMLAMCRARLDNDPAAELGVAAQELGRITRLRLERLLAMGS